MRERTPITLSGTTHRTVPQTAYLQVIFESVLFGQIPIQGALPLTAVLICQDGEDTFLANLSATEGRVSQILCQ